MAYIDQISRNKGCFLCDAARTGEPSAENLVLWRGDLALCIMNRYPYNNGHLLVAPRAHKADLADLSGDECLALLDALARMKKVLAEAMSPDGFNIGLNLGKAAGAGLEDHLHFHIVPRWQGDTNFMPVVGEVRVLPEALAATYAKLAGGF